VVGRPGRNHQIGLRRLLADDAGRLDGQRRAAHQHEIDAVVVVGGMGSIMGSIVTGIGLGLIEGIVKSGMIANLLSSTFDSVPVAGSIVYPIKLLFSPEASAVTIFVIMAIVLLVRPAGLFGRER